MVNVCIRLTVSAGLLRWLKALDSAWARWLLGMSGGISLTSNERGLGVATVSMGTNRATVDSHKPVTSPSYLCTPCGRRNTSGKQRNKYWPIPLFIGNGTGHKDTHCRNNRRRSVEQKRPSVYHVQIYNFLVLPTTFNNKASIYQSYYNATDWYCCHDR